MPPKRQMETPSALRGYAASDRTAVSPGSAVVKLQTSAAMRKGDKFETYYSILGVDKAASTEEIRK